MPLSKRDFPSLNACHEAALRNVSSVHPLIVGGVFPDLGQGQAAHRPWILDPTSALCEPVIFEILYHPTTEERPLIEAQFSTFPVLLTPPCIWCQASLLGQRCCSQGCNAGSLDLISAATAIHHNAEIVTYDADFSTISTASTLRVQLLSRP